MAYIDQSHTYTDPKAYDDRTKGLLERYNKRAWDPVIAASAKKYISANDTVCDFGCGTLAHIDWMQQAKKIYAIDVNKAMLDTGLKKLSPAQREKIEPVVSDACHTPLQGALCSIVWSIGLTEYTDLDGLFQEMTRVSTPDATMLLQFPNAHNLMHIAIRILNTMRYKKTKRFRTLREIRNVSNRYGWSITHVQSAFIRNNLWCVLRKSSEE
ncbi:MAG TPA: class I SAM-dependent methyltransferase [Candidatus Andersenbacteria bacterium]|nr:class I SAM-dependent methyltransferase [Candidatus Andersenbacteria bacterium]